MKETVSMFSVYKGAMEKQVQETLCVNNGLQVYRVYI